MELLALLHEGQKRVKKGSHALPTWKLSVQVFFLSYAISSHNVIISSHHNRSTKQMRAHLIAYIWPKRIALTQPNDLRSDQCIGIWWRWFLTTHQIRVKRAERNVSSAKRCWGTFRLQLCCTKMTLVSSASRLPCLSFFCSSYCSSALLSALMLSSSPPLSSNSLLSSFHLIDMLCCSPLIFCSRALNIHHVVCRWIACRSWITCREWRANICTPSLLSNPPLGLNATSWCESKLSSGLFSLSLLSRLFLLFCCRSSHSSLSLLLILLSLPLFSFLPSVVYSLLYMRWRWDYMRWRWD